MTDTNALSEVLATAQEKLSEGDYLKVANFLKTLHETKSDIVKTIITNIHITIKWITSKDAPITLEIHTKKEVIVRSRHPDISLNEVDSKTYNGVLNGTSFELKEKDLIIKVSRLWTTFGMRNIERTLDGITETFMNMKEFRKYLAKQEVHEGESDYDCWDAEGDNYTKAYVVSSLIGIGVYSEE